MGEIGKFKIGDRVMYCEGDMCTVIAFIEQEGKFIVKSDTWRSSSTELLFNTGYDTVDGYFWDNSEGNFSNHYRKIKDTKLARKMYEDIDKEEGGYIWVR